MSNFADTFEWIEAYLDGELSPEQVQEIENKINSDSEFEAEVTLQKNTRSLLELQTQAEYKQMFSDLDKQKKEDTPVISMGRASNRISLMMKIAAAVTILVMAGAWFFMGNKGGVSQDELFAAHYQSYPDRLGIRGETDSDRDSLMFIALTDYTKGRYDKAIAGFEMVLSGDQNDQGANFYLAETYMANKDYKKAIGQFEKLPGDSQFSEVANWHLALAQLKTGNLEVARKLFNSISTEKSNAYRENAVEILKELR